VNAKSSPSEITKRHVALGKSEATVSAAVESFIRRPDSWRSLLTGSCYGIAAVTACDIRVSAVTNAFQAAIG